MSKHTKGPWVIDGGNDEYVSQNFGDEIGIAHVLNVDKGGDKDWYQGEETKANSRLIKAAPEMFEALDNITGLSRALRVGGPDPMDLQGLSDALEEAIHIAADAIAAATSRGEA